MTDTENGNFQHDFLPVKNCSTPIVDDDLSLFEFEQNEKLVQAELSGQSVAFNFNEPINQLEKMIDQINNSELDCTLESFGDPIEENKDQIQNKLEDEIKRRVFLEQKISELNKEKLELAQKLSISEEKVTKKGLLLKNFQSNLIKAVENWKNKEKELMDLLDKAKSDKQNTCFELTKITMVFLKVFKIKLIIKLLF